MSGPTDQTAKPLAIIGMACRLPGADGLEQFWELVSQGRSAVADAPPELFDRELYYDPQKGVRAKSYSQRAAVLADRTFDPKRYPIPEELVRSVDRTHLLMTGVTADALRHGGLDPFNLPLKNTGIFIGHAQGSSRLGELTYRTYLAEAVALLDDLPAFSELSAAERSTVQQQLEARIRARLPAEEANVRSLYCNMVAGTVAKAFGLDGAWLALNSACASSLHAMLLGARALQLGRSDMVIVGGASDCKCDSLVLFSAAQTLSTTDSRPFDADADGLIMSEGYVALVMKTLERALADGDPIQAVVRGLGVASDGRGKSLWAPRKEGQMKAMQRAYRSGVEMSGLQYLEAHATSTQVGDATELETLGEVLGPKFPAGKRIPVTSVKANIGHTLEAAGVAGVIKTVLCMQHRQFPAAINIRAINPKVDWDNAPYYIPLAPAAWEAPGPGQPRRGAVNAFGIGGMNMHVVLDEFTDSARQLVAKTETTQNATPEDRAVAVIGIGCVLPGAMGAAGFWQALESARDPKTAPADGRWNAKDVAEQARLGRPAVGGFVTDFAYDWRRHKVPPKQVQEADPLQFMLLEAAEQALNDAGFDKKPLDRLTCGVAVGTEFGGDFCDHLEMGLRLPEMQHVLADLLTKRGVSLDKIQTINSTFADKLLKKWPSLVDETGSFTSSTLASRITKTLDLAGGAVSIDSGATSAMSALSVCIDMLLSGDNDLMICAAGQRRMGPGAFDVLYTAGLLADASGPRSVLDANYQGVVPAEGVGVVVLKRLADARRDGDRIHAIIRGLGIAHQATTTDALQLASQRACAAAGVDASQIVLAEVDTDERLSPDSAELRTLVSEHAGAQTSSPLVMGSATAQFGHLGGGSGMTALIKASLEVERGQAMPSVGFETPAAALQDAGRAVQVARGVAKISGRRLASVACWSKGLACHLILEEPTGPLTKARVVPPAATSTQSSDWRICRWGAASFEQLGSQVAAAQADANKAWGSAAAQFDASARYRLAIVADGPASLAKKLQLTHAQIKNPAAHAVLEQQGVYFRELPSVRPKVAFVFPGQGSQYDGMLRELVLAVPAAAATLATADATMQRLGFPTFAELAWNTPTQLGSDVWTTQVSMLLADALALSALKSLGIEPELVLGHSYGEFVALYAAGAWDLETAIRMTRARCEGIVAVARGGSGMLATNAPQSHLESLFKTIPGELYFANLNAPDQTVLGGKRPQLEALAQALEAGSYHARILAVPAAFHTPLMAGASRLLEQQLQRAALQTPRVPMISTVTNAPIADVTEIRRNLAAQLTTPVRYSQLIAELASREPTVFVEVGPQQTLTRLNRRIVSADVNTIATDNPKRPGVEPLLCVQALLECLGALSKPLAAAPSRSTAALRSSVVTPPSSQLSKPPVTMHDNIPHFDATERRRAKMRAGSAAKPAPGAAVEPPATAPPITAPRATSPTNGTAAHAAPKQPAANGTPAPKAAVAPPARSNGVAPAASSSRINGIAAPPKPVAVAPAPQPVAPAKPAASRPAPAELESFLINFVVEQTGYPAEVVDLDADLEADLGIDSIKKAQLFGELQEYFDVSASTGGSLSLDDFPTLRHVLDFLHSSNGASAAASAPAPQPTAAPAPASHPVAAVQPTAQPAAPTAGRDQRELASFLINFVVEQTGYPAEVVDLDADLEADLGIDSIKKAQLFGELQEYFDVGTAAGGNLSLDDFPTLRHVLDFLASAPAPSAPATAPAAAVVAHAAPAAAVQATASTTATVHQTAAAPVQDAQQLESFLVNFVVEQTGYPAEVVDLDADLEADLGIDSIKKAQLFGELQEYFDVGTGAGGNLSLDDFPTLRHVLDFLAHSAPASAGGAGRNGQVSATVIPAPAVAVAPTSAPVAVCETTAPSDASQLESFLVNFVVEQTGYPAEVVDLDADLEADLGIDSIKKAQLFGELQEYFDIGGTNSVGSFSLDDFPTLRHVRDFLVSASAASDRAASSVNETVENHVPYTNGHVHAERPQAVPTIDDTPKPVAGTPYEIGWAQGKQAMKSLLAALRRQADRLQPELSDGIDTFAGLHADQLDHLLGVAEAIEVPLGNVLALRRSTESQVVPQLAETMRVDSLSATRAEAEWPAVQSTDVTTRFALEMRDAPLADITAGAPSFSGAAIVLGVNAEADALCARLERAGVEVHLISPDAELDETLQTLERICADGPAPHLFITTARDGAPCDVYDSQAWSRRSHETIELPFFICQKWLQLAEAGQWLDRATLVALTAMGGDFGFDRGSVLATGGGQAGLLKAIFIEYSIMRDLPSLRVKVVDAAGAAPPAEIVNQVFAELASNNRDYEVSYASGRRQVPFAVERAVAPASQSSIRSGAVWVVTGGARGITAACALELGRRYGLRLHLLGTTAPPQIDPAWRSLDDAGLESLKAQTMIAARKAGQPAAAAWQRVQKDLEIDRSLRMFADAGVTATYHVCDVTDRAALAETLADIRRADGPIEGILHGAGIDRSCRFDRKQLEVVRATVGAKVHGAAHLMALTRRDPVRHFIGFGSISGRLGSFGQTDYCLSSDMLCKLMGAYRRQRPWVHAVGLHWHPWDEVGMAARPETKSVLQGKSDLHLMPLAEGIAHLVRELAAGPADSEALITERRHWQRFAAGLGELVVGNGAADVAATDKSASNSAEVTAAVEPSEDVELHTERCRMRLLAAPLPKDAPAHPAFDGPVWILGNNSFADLLASRLAQQGNVVERLPHAGDADAALAEVERLWGIAPAKHLFLLSGRDAATDLLGESAMRQRSNEGVMLPFLLAQRWYKLLAGRPELGDATLMAAVSLGGDFGFGGNAVVPSGGAIGGLLKAVHIEDSRREAPRVRVKVIDAPAQERDEQLLDGILREMAASAPEIEVAWSRGVRRVVRPLPAAINTNAAPEIPRGGTWVITGGARGITAIAARELARRYGWKLHLIGKSPAPDAGAVWRNYSEAEMKSLRTTLAREAVAAGRSPSEAWDRVMKDVEIFNNLGEFAAAGVQATYHSCDIGDRAALAAVLADVRRHDGPISGILHGAGVIDPSRFENKRLAVIRSLIGAKFDGTLNLMALTQGDPLRYFVAFGSISGRFGGNGLTDYAAGNDGLAKLVDWFRTRRRDCASSCIHWESWEGSGMATLPRYAWGPKSVMNMKYMQPAEGVRRLEQELQAGLPESEVLYTFGDFYPMFYPHEQYLLGEFVPAGQQTSAPSAASIGLVQNIRRESSGAVGDVPLDPETDTFLVQHRLRDKALLPVVVGLESLAEVAGAAGGRTVVGFRRVQMLDGLLFHTSRAVTAQAKAEVAADGAVQCRLTCDFRNRTGGLIQKDRPYLQAIAELSDTRPVVAANLPAPPSAWTSFAYPDQGPVYHGPTLRGVNGVAFDRAGGWGRIVSLPLVDFVGPARVGKWQVPSCVLDAALYACGVHLWMHGEGAISLPKSIDHLQLGRAPRDGETCLVYFQCREIASATATYDFTVMGDDGALVAKADGYQKVILARGGGA